MDFILKANENNRIFGGKIRLAKGAGSRNAVHGAKPLKLLGRTSTFKTKHGTSGSYLPAP
ncbi:MAG TPA: hypothetical protein VK152_01555 [Paludibacter sp.]|nr:hypothetical protein [Paludibacter sp.]